MESVSFLISFAIAYFALRAYRVTRQKGILYLHLGFLLMAVAMLARVVSVSSLLLVSEPVAPRGSLDVLLFTVEVVYSAVRFLAYGIFVLMYARHSLRQPEGLVLAVLPFLVYNPFFELGAALLLIYVVLQTALNWLVSKKVEASLVFVGFALLMVSHVLFLLTLRGFGFYLAGQASQLAGLMLMLAMVVKVNKG